jgi:hypothetical protein
MMDVRQTFVITSSNTFSEKLEVEKVIKKALYAEYRAYIFR